MKTRKEYKSAKYVTKRGSGVVRNSVSCSRGPRFVSQPGDRLLWTRFFV